MIKNISLLFTAFITLLLLSLITACDLPEETVADPTTAPLKSLETSILPPMPEETPESEAQNKEREVIETQVPASEDETEEAPVEKIKMIPALKNDVNDLSPYLELENLSDLADLFVKKNSTLLRPSRAYDKDRIILSSWDLSTGYSSELFLYDIRDQSLLSIFKCSGKYESAHIYKPVLTDIEEEKLLISHQIHCEDEQRSYIYDLNSANLTEISLTEAEREIRYSNIFNTTNNDYTFEEIEGDDSDYPWVLRNTKTKEVIGRFAVSGRLSYLGEDLFVHTSRSKDHYYLYHEGQWYEFPETIEDWYILGIDALPDGHFFIYVADHIGIEFGRLLAIKYVLRGQLSY